MQVVWLHDPYIAFPTVLYHLPLRFKGGNNDLVSSRGCVCLCDREEENFSEERIDAQGWELSLQTKQNNKTCLCKLQWGVTSSRHKASAGCRKVQALQGPCGFLFYFTKVLPYPWDPSRNQNNGGSIWEWSLSQKVVKLCLQNLLTWFFPASETLRRQYWKTA